MPSIIRFTPTGRAGTTWPPFSMADLASKSARGQCAQALGTLVGVRQAGSFCERSGCRVRLRPTGAATPAVLTLRPV